MDALKEMKLVREFIMSWAHSTQPGSAAGHRCLDIAAEFARDAEEAKGEFPVCTADKPCPKCEPHEPDDKGARELQHIYALRSAAGYRAVPASFDSLADCDQAGWRTLYCYVRKMIADAVKACEAAFGMRLGLDKLNHAAELSATKEAHERKIETRVTETANDLQRHCERLVESHAKELKDARRTALVDACKAVCCKCRRCPDSMDPKYFERTEFAVEYPACHIASHEPGCLPIRRLIAALDAEGTKGGAK